MPAYLTRSEFRALTVMPGSDVDDLESAAPGWIDAQALSLSAMIDGRLRKRYAVPFPAPYPEIVKSWLQRLLTLRCYLRRGVNAQDAQFRVIQEDADAAGKELAEAANAETGLWDLPLRANESGTGISKGAPLAYSEASPFRWQDEQMEAIRNGG